MNTARVAIGEHAAVASEQPLATMAGYAVLRNGGNAFDAAVATSFSLAVTLPYAGGLGGDFFGMFFESKTGRIHCLNSSGWAPSGMTPDSVAKRGDGGVPLFGPFSVVVPGLIAGVSAMHEKLGRREFGSLLSAPSQYASSGFPAAEGLCKVTSALFDSLSPEAKNVFAPDGKPPMPGRWIRQAELGRVIREVIDRGADGFYGGWPAEAIRENLASFGLQSEKSDFAEFKPEWVEPLSLDYRGTTVHEIPPNSMGATSLLMLKLLSSREMSEEGSLSRERIRFTMEAAEVAYARKDLMLGDPRFGPVDIEAFLDTRKKGARPGNQVIRDGDTTAFSIADSEGNMVSGIQSLYHPFGSRVFVPSCGIMLNNRGAGFATKGPNKVEPLKRPLHTLSSLILERNGAPYLAIGTSGGDYRPMQHALFVTNLVDYGMSAEEAVEHPRFLWSGGRRVLIERGYEAPSSRRYEVEALPHLGKTGVCQAVEVLPRGKKAVCDPRGGGLPIGL